MIRVRTEADLFPPSRLSIYHKSEKRAQKKREAEAEAEKRAAQAMDELKARSAEEEEEEEEESSPQKMDAAMSHPPLLGQQSDELLYDMNSDGEEQGV